MTRDEFGPQIGRLIVLRGWPDDDGEHFAALADVPLDVFTAAVDHALRTRTFFPVPAELRADCDAVAARFRAASAEVATITAEDLAEGQWVEIMNPLGGAPLRLLVTRDWKHDCAECSDTGWASRWCAEKLPRQDFSVCGRRNDPYPHDYVERCACVEWNPTIRRRKEAQQKYSHAPEKVGA